MTSRVLSTLVLLLLATAAVHADPPGAEERVKKGGGKVFLQGPGGSAMEFGFSERTTDADLAVLCELRGLQILALDNTQVTDEGLRTIGELRQLRYLVLSSDYITDAGLRHLEAMDTLKKLRLSRCPNVTEEGVDRLRKALPGCYITCGR
jgi:hypothetical protein